MSLDEEFSRAGRVADMLASGHSFLRDTFARRAVVLDALILFTSAWTAALGLLDPSIGERMQIPSFKISLAIGTFGVFTFILSILQLRLDWKQMAGQHEVAARQYASLKLVFRAIVAEGEGMEAEKKDALRRYYELGDHLIQIPEASFLKIKAKHYKKIAISREIDKYPSSSLWTLKIKLWVRDTFRSFGNRIGAE